MLYLTIPEGMVYQQKNINGEATDLFVDPAGVKPDIRLQWEVKEALRTNTKHKKAITRPNFVIYKSTPPYEAKSFLSYDPRVC